MSEAATEYRLSHRFTLVREDDIRAQAAFHVERIRKTYATKGKPDGLRLWFFPSDDDATRVSGKPTKAAIHNAVMKEVAAAMAQDGVTVTFITLRAEDYFAWLGNRPNTAQRPGEYVTRNWKG